jgi:protein-disulfide isomerase
MRKEEKKEIGKTEIVRPGVVEREKKVEEVKDKEVSSDMPRQETHSEPVRASEPSLTTKMRNNPWMISTIVFAAVALILLFSNFSNGITGASVAVVSADDASGKVLNFVNSQVEEPVTLVEVNEKSGLYEVIVNYLGQDIPVYVTKDGLNLVQLTPFDLLAEASNDSGSVISDEPVLVSVDDDAVKGSANAPVTIIEFSDFQCPFCAKFYEETYSQLVSQYINTGKVKLVFRDFPLTSIHADALKAAEATECARKQGGDVMFFKYHDKLFENQNSLGVDSLKSYAQQLGLNTADFNSCLDSGEMEDEVKADLQEGASYGVTGTPAFFINGRLLAGAYPFSEFQKIIEEELSSSAQ